VTYRVVVSRERARRFGRAYSAEEALEETRGAKDELGRRSPVDGHGLGSSKVCAKVEFVVRMNAHGLREMDKLVRDRLSALPNGGRFSFVVDADGVHVADSKADES